MGDVTGAEIDAVCAELDLARHQHDVACLIIQLRRERDKARMLADEDIEDVQKDLEDAWTDRDRFQVQRDAAMERANDAEIERNAARYAMNTLAASRHTQDALEKFAADNIKLSEERDALIMQVVDLQNDVAHWQAWQRGIEQARDQMLRRMSYLEAANARFDDAGRSRRVAENERLRVALDFATARWRRPMGNTTNAQLAYNLGYDNPSEPHEYPHHELEHAFRCGQMEAQNQRPRNLQYDPDEYDHQTAERLDEQSDG